MRSAAANTQCRAIVRDNEQLGRRPRSPRSADVKNHYVSTRWWVGRVGRVGRHETTRKGECERYRVFGAFAIYTTVLRNVLRIFFKIMKNYKSFYIAFESNCEKFSGKNKTNYLIRNVNVIKKQWQKSKLFYARTLSI
jgi:hypothetical protein